VCSRLHSDAEGSFGQHPCKGTKQKEQDRLGPVRLLRLAYEFLIRHHSFRRNAQTAELAERRSRMAVIRHQGNYRYHGDQSCPGHRLLVLVVVTVLKRLYKYPPPPPAAPPIMAPLPPPPANLRLRRHRQPRRRWGHLLPPMPTLIPSGYRLIVFGPNRLGDHVLVPDPRPRRSINGCAPALRRHPVSQRFRAGA
jgi:hypothetical protein